MTKTYTNKSLADLLGISQATVYRLVVAGKIEPTNQYTQSPRGRALSLYRVVDERLIARVKQAEEERANA